MYILLILWFVIDVLFLIALLLRGQLTKHQNKMWQRSIEREKSLGERVLDIVSEASSLAPMIFFIFIVIYIIPDIMIQKLLEWYRGIFIAALFPVFFSWIKDKNINIRSAWKWILICLAIFSSMLGNFIDLENVEEIAQYRYVLNVFITMFVVTFIVALYEMRKESNKYYSKRLPKKGIRKDLYYRTPGLMVNVSDVELIRYCERYFDEYICKYRKMKDLRTIEYVNLAGMYRKLWYKKAANFMKIFVVINIFIVVIGMKFGISYKQLGIIGLIFVFGVMVSICKHIDLECLYKIGIRYVYDEWGYYLTCARRSKFVGDVQMIAVSKFHKYVYSFLDIVALCRAVAFIDKLSGEKKICIITRNLSELFTNYTNYEQEKSWIMVIPLWIAALFEFYVTGGVEEEVKKILLKSADESVRADISIFLQSFWADMERKKLTNGILDYLRLFKAELYI